MLISPLPVVDKRRSKRSRTCGQNKQITFHGTPELQSGGVNQEYSEEYYFSLDFLVFFSGRDIVKSWMEMFQFKVSLNVFPSFRSGTQYLIFIYVNNNKGGTKTSFETEFYRNWVSQKFRLDCLKIVWCSHERVHRNFQNISVLPFVFRRNPNLLLLSRRTVQSVKL